MKPARLELKCPRLVRRGPRGTAGSNPVIR